jgi:hypothetical protein
MTALPFRIYQDTPTTNETRLCECGCKRPLTGHQKSWATVSCRSRKYRADLGAIPRETKSEQQRNKRKVDGVSVRAASEDWPSRRERIRAKYGVKLPKIGENTI